MKLSCLIRTISFSSVLALLAVGGCSTSRQSTQTPAASGYPFKVGMAEIDITPPIGHRMAGYFEERFATGVHDPLMAKAIVLQQGKTEVAMVFCDLVGLSLHVTTNARVIVSRETGIPITNIFMAATHSHTGPLFDDVRRDYAHDLAVSETGHDPHETIYYPAVLME